MIAGYGDEDDRVFCVECWVKRPGTSPTRILDTEDPEDPTSNFWIVDKCWRCQRDVKYQRITMLA